MLTYGRHAVLDEITGPDGRPVSRFKNPKIRIDALVLQGIYTVAAVGNGAVGVTVITPVINQNAKFAPGPALHDNGLAIGDTYLGAFYQSKPIRAGGRDVLWWRAELGADTPTGDFNSSKTITQSAGFWSLIPHIAATCQPTPRFEVSTRVHYLYNFATSRAPDPPPFPELPFRKGQAGQAIWANFAASYQVVVPSFSLGVNGYWLTQLTDNRYDGLDVPNRRAEELYVGPGFHWTATKTDVLNTNVYFPVSIRNRFQGQQVNLEYVHAF